MCIIKLSRFGIFCAVLNILVGNLHAQQPRLYLPLDDGYVSQCVQGVNGDTSHQGIATKYDIDLNTSNFLDENVRAAISGIAYIHFDSNNFGNHINIDIGNSLFALTGHMKEIFVGNGQYVYAGQIIGKEGCTGFCFGDHIHFGLHRGNPSENAANSESVPMERIVAIDVADNIVREFKGEDFICDIDYNVGHRYRAVNKELKAGLFPDGWHTDGVSQAFLNVYNFFTRSDGHNKLGQPHDNNGGGAYVHEWWGAWVQDFYQSNSANPRFGAGYTMLVYNPAKRAAFLLRDGFRWQYANNNGPLTYGVPTMDERSWNNSSIWILGVPSGYYSRQDFSLGKTMLWSQTTGVLVVDTNTLPVFTISGSGGEPFTLSGRSTTKIQVYIFWTGGLSLESNDWYRIMQNSIEVSQTTLPEATFTNLSPGVSWY